MYVTVPEAVQCGIFGTADADEPEWLRANTLWAPTMDEATIVAASNTIQRFFTLSSPYRCWLFTCRP
jgi:hypothetical protein